MAGEQRRARIAVIGHVEHITIGRVPAVPKEGEIAHLATPRAFAGGGGGVAFFQLARSDAEILLFTALGNDDAARFVEERIVETGARVYAARRNEPHTRDIVMVTPKGERTIVVTGEPLHPMIGDPLPWHELASCDAVYFTAQEPALLEEARRADTLVVAARRRPSLVTSKVRADLVIGSANDPKEASTLADYPIPPAYLVMTEGELGGRIETREGSKRFSSPKVQDIKGSAYGAGDTFAAALTYHVARGFEVQPAASVSARYGAAVLRALCPIDAQEILTGP